MTVECMKKIKAWTAVKNIFLNKKKERITKKKTNEELCKELEMHEHSFGCMRRPLNVWRQISGKF